MGNYYQPEIETASREQSLAWQNERLVKQVQHVWDNVPYYRKKMEEKGVTPADIQGTEIARGVDLKTANRHFKMQVRLLGDLCHCAVANRTDKLTRRDRCALFDSFRKGLAEVLVERGGISVMGNGNTFTHQGVVPHLLHDSVGRGDHRCALLGVDVNAEMDTVIVHRGGKYLKLGIVLHRKSARNGEHKIGQL